MTEFPQSTRATDVNDETKQLLQELRTRVRYLMQEIRRLRKENATMTERLEELEERVAHDGTLLMLEEDPDALRDQINTYIEAIDNQLGER
jgi:regulator of replication initiation timing